MPGVVHAKTGYIGGVRSLSGYVPAKNGKSIVFSFIYNRIPGQVKPYEELQDHAVRTLMSWPDLDYVAPPSTQPATEPATRPSTRPSTTVARATGDNRRRGLPLARVFVSRRVDPRRDKPRWASAACRVAATPLNQSIRPAQRAVGSNLVVAPSGNGAKFGP